MMNDANAAEEAETGSEALGLSVHRTAVASPLKLAMPGETDLPAEFIASAHCIRGHNRSDAVPTLNWRRATTDAVRAASLSPLSHLHTLAPTASLRFFREGYGDVAMDQPPLAPPRVA
jgi:hypothetical protein